jgi:Cof subfamily protein (haloacid dehalogenase superfamily)
MIDLICIDVDGTLVGSSGTVPDEVWTTADRLRARGVRLAICSGRPAFGITRGYAERLDAGGWHVFQNGSSVVHLPTGRSLSTPLGADNVRALVARARETGRILELYTDDGYVEETGSDRARRHAGLLGLEYQQRSLDAIDPARVVRAQWLIDPSETDAIVAEAGPALHLSPSIAPIMPDTVFLNITAAGVDKAFAVRAVARAYGVALDRVMMVGDGFNDAEAMRAVGFPVAMGNAEPAARAVARHHVAHVDEGGLTEALELALAA